MSNGVQVPAEQSTVSLLTDILGDLQRLVEQQFLLTRREIEQELRERMSGNICRCGAYSNIVDAITEVAGRQA